MITRVLRYVGADSPSARGALVIAMGFGVSQVVVAATAPILTRLYTPAEFGVFSVVSATSLALGIVAPLRYDFAVHLAPSDEDARALVRLGLLVSLATGAVYLLFVAAFAQHMDRLLDDPALRSWVFTSPLFVVVIGWYQVLNQWALRNGRYFACARRNALNGTLGSSAQVLLGLFVSGPLGLIVGAITGQFAAAATLLRGAGLRTRLGARALRRNASRYARFPLLFAPAGLLSASTAFAPLVIIAAEFGTASAGWFGLAQRIIGLPVMLLGQGVGQVYLSRLANARRDGSGRERRMFFFVTRALCLGGVALGALTFFAGPWAFEVVFGQEWYTSGLVARALSVGLVAQFVVSPLGQTLMVYERGRLQLVYDATRLVLLCSSMILLAVAGASFLDCVWAYSLVLVLTYAWWWEMSRRTIRQFSAPHETRSMAPTEVKF